ncbi:MAG: twin-arginine translocation signal domain-containing protein [Dehalococcoidia bacterium]|nr:twin-arginine translocation signal domain-containing protein [Dehalococcoidia bacterium]
MEVSRRNFIKVTGASTAGAVLFNGCTVPDREKVIQSPNQLPEDTVSSFENWYASVCRGCSAGCGIIVRVVEGRAKKIEGNPDHPVSQGRLCARGQAGLQDLYHPDRIRSPLRRVGPRGSGRYDVISWDDAQAELTGRLKALAEEGKADSVVLATEPLRGLNAFIAQQFSTIYGARLLAFEPLDQGALWKASRDVFGEDTIPFFDIERANYVLSFGANFLEPWLSQVSYSRAYGEFRQGERREQRGHLVQFEPRMSMTGANADEWVTIKPGSEGILAMSMAYVIIAEGLANRAVVDIMTARGGASALAAFRPEEASKQTGVPAERIQGFARAFAKTAPALAIGGAGAAAHTNGSFNLTAILALNFLVGNINRPGGVFANPTASIPEFSARVTAAPYREWQRLADRFENPSLRPVGMLLVNNTNPLYGLPLEARFGDGLKKVPMIVSFSNMMDETTVMADLILPSGSYLESWGDDIPEPGIGYETISFQQPVVRPMYLTRSFADVMLASAAGLGGQLKTALPWENQQAALKAAADKVFKLNRGSVRGPSFAGWWNGVLQRGGWWDFTPTGRKDIRVAAPTLPRQVISANFAGSDKEFPFHLTIFASTGVGDGRGAHLPWLQMTPDPTTTIAWQSWIEVNPKTATRLGLKSNDIVTVTAPNNRKLEAIVYVYPAIPEDVVAMPAGQGHSFMGRYAQKRGANPLAILASQVDSDTGALAWGATRVRIDKTGRTVRLPKLEGAVPAVQPPDYEVVQITDLRKAGGN